MLIPNFASLLQNNLINLDSYLVIDSIINLVLKIFEKT